MSISFICPALLFCRRHPISIKDSEGRSMSCFTLKAVHLHVIYVGLKGIPHITCTWTPGVVILWSASERIWGAQVDNADVGGTGRVEKIPKGARKRSEQGDREDKAKERRRPPATHASILRTTSVYCRTTAAEPKASVSLQQSQKQLYRCRFVALQPLMLRM